jgi:hypothetical protein
MILVSSLASLMRVSASVPSRQSRFSLIFFVQQEPEPEPEPSARIRFRFRIFLGQNDTVPAVLVPVPAPVPQHCLEGGFTKEKPSMLNISVNSKPYSKLFRVFIGKIRWVLLTNKPVARNGCVLTHLLLGHGIDRRRRSQGSI